MATANKPKILYSFLSVRVTKTLRDQTKEKASNCNMSVNQYIRSAIVAKNNA